MKRMKKGIAVILALVLCLSLAACGSSKKETEYSNKGASYTIKMPGTWETVDAGSDDYLTLENKAKTINIAIQKVAKADMEGQEFDLQTFMDLSAQLMQPVFGDIQPVESDLTLDGMKAAKSREYKIEQNGEIVMLYMAFVESETAFYSYNVTATEKEYKKIGEDLKNALKTFAEK